MKKFLISSILCALLITSLGMSVFASSLFASNSHTNNLPGSDKWNRGIKSGTNGYYIAYSYYYNSSYSHSAKASLPNGTRVSQVYSPGSTAVVNSLSEPSYAGGYTGAATYYNNVWRYVEDSGRGEALVHNWN